MIKILFVCLGNICRSPTAEGVFRHQANEYGIKDGFTHNVYIDSAGTAGFHMAAPPDKRAQLTALKYGVDNHFHIHGIVDRTPCIGIVKRGFFAV